VRGTKSNVIIPSIGDLVTVTYSTSRYYTRTMTGVVLKVEPLTSRIMEVTLLTELGVDSVGLARRGYPLKLNTVVVLQERNPQQHA